MEGSAYTTTAASRLGSAASSAFAVIELPLISPAKKQGCIMARHLNYVASSISDTYRQSHSSRIDNSPCPHSNDPKEGFLPWQIPYAFNMLDAGQLLTVDPGLSHTYMENQRSGDEGFPMNTKPSQNRLFLEKTVAIFHECLGYISVTQPFP